MDDIPEKILAQFINLFGICLPKNFLSTYAYTCTNDILHAHAIDPSGILLFYMLWCCIDCRESREKRNGATALGDSKSQDLGFDFGAVVNVRCMSIRLMSVSHFQVAQIWPSAPQHLRPNGQHPCR